MSLGLNRAGRGGLTHNTAAADNLRVLRTPYPLFANVAAASVSATAYFVYLRYLTTQKLVKFVEFALTANGSGTNTGEVGLFSTPTGPNRSAQVFTKLISDATLDSMVTGSVPRIIRNTTPFSTSGFMVPPGHLWAGCRIALGTGQPNVRWLLADHGLGSVQSTAAAAAFTSTASYTGVIPAVVGNATPECWASMD